MCVYLPTSARHEEELGSRFAHTYIYVCMYVFLNVHRRHVRLIHTYIHTYVYIQIIRKKHVCLIHTYIHTHIHACLYNIHKKHVYLMHTYIHTTSTYISDIHTYIHTERTQEALKVDEIVAEMAGNNAGERLKWREKLEKDVNDRLKKEWDHLLERQRCVCICMYVCIYLCVCVYMCVFMHVCMLTYI